MVRRSLVLGGTLVLATVLAYLPAMCGGFIWDDREYVEENLTLQSFEGLWAIWTDVKATPQYYPLVHTSFWCEYHLWGLNPHGYHITNVVLHSVNVILFWRLLCTLGVPGAWLAAALFAVHPVEVESVAWITERKNVLSGSFYLLSALCFLSFANSPERAEPGRRWQYVASIGLYVAALLSKTVTASLPAALLVVQWWRAGRITRRDVVLTIPMFAVGVPLALLTAWLEKHQVGAKGPDWNFTMIDRCLIAGRALWFYIGRLLWPHPLIFFYPRWQIDSTQAWQFGYPVAFVGAVVGLWLARKRVGRGPLAAVLFFAGTLFPAIGFFDVYPMRFSFVADHFQYLASIGLLALAAAGVALLARRVPRIEGIGRITLSLVLLLLSGLTWRQACVYESLESLWTDTLQKNPNAWIAWVNFANLRREQNRPDEAIALFRRALEVKPDYANARNDLGSLLLSQGRIEEAREQMTLAIALSPQYSQAYNNLGNLYYTQRDFEKAVEYFKKAIELNPRNALAHHNIGAVLEAEGRVDEAVRSYEEAIAIRPENAMTQANLGWLYVRRGQRERGIAHLQTALNLNPNLRIAREYLERSLAP